MKNYNEAPSDVKDEIIEFIPHCLAMARDMLNNNPTAKAAANKSQFVFHLEPFAANIGANGDRAFRLLPKKDDETVDEQEALLRFKKLYAEIEQPQKIVAIVYTGYNEFAAESKGFQQCVIIEISHRDGYFAKIHIPYAFKGFVNKKFVHDADGVSEYDMSPERFIAL